MGQQVAMLPSHSSRVRVWSPVTFSAELCLFCPCPCGFFFFRHPRFITVQKRGGLTTLKFPFIMPCKYVCVWCLDGQTSHPACIPSCRWCTQDNPGSTTGLNRIKHSLMMNYWIITPTQFDHMCMQTLGPDPLPTTLGTVWIFWWLIEDPTFDTFPMPQINIMST